MWPRNSAARLCLCNRRGEVCALEYLSRLRTGPGEDSAHMPSRAEWLAPGLQRLLSGRSLKQISDSQQQVPIVAQHKRACVAPQWQLNTSFNYELRRCCILQSRGEVILRRFTI